MSIKKWNVLKADKDLARELSAETGIDPFGSLLLAIRGISDPMEAEEFLSNEINLQDPFCFADMDKAVERINLAIENDEKIAIFGDYDCDGVTSTALLYSYLSSVEANVLYRLPSREEGYGITNSAIDELHKKGVSLIITVDNGISAYDEVEYAKTLDIDVVVTDHHIPPEKLPNAVAVVDPKREDDYSEFKGYAGVGVAFMLICALADASPEEMLTLYGDLVAIGTIADVMPMKYDNRVIVKKGLSLIKKRRRVAISALIETAGLAERETTSTLVSFGLAPRINAAGRMLTPDNALSLLLCDDYQEALPIARALNDLNLQRQKLESDIIAEAEENLFLNELNLMQPIMVVYGHNWHHGVLGLISAKLCKKYSRPCIALSIDDDIVVGSARSYGGVSIYDLIYDCSHLLITFGGHETAAGLRLSKDNLSEFITAINNAAHCRYPIMPFDYINLDCKLNPKSLSIAHAYSQRQLQPYGNGNEQPIFGLYGMTITAVNAVGKGNHLKLTLARNDCQITAMKFFTTLQEFSFSVGDMIDLAVNIDVSRFADTENLSIVVYDIKPYGVDNEKITEQIRKYENFRLFDEVDDIDLPTRDDIAAVYKIIRARRHILANYDMLLYIFSCDDYFKLRIILDILRENKLIDACFREFCEISYIEFDGKVDLEKSNILISLKERVKNNGI